MFGYISFRPLMLSYIMLCLDIFLSLCCLFIFAPWHVEKIFFMRELFLVKKIHFHYALLCRWLFRTSSISCISFCILWLMVGSVRNNPALEYSSVQFCLTHFPPEYCREAASSADCGRGRPWPWPWSCVMRWAWVHFRSRHFVWAVRFKSRFLFDLVARLLPSFAGFPEGFKFWRKKM